MIIRNLKELATATGLSQQEIADKMGWGKSMASLIANENYPKWEMRTKQAVRYMLDNGILEGEVEGLDINPIVGDITIDHDTFLKTDNVNALNSLLDGLLDEESSLNASIGLATGRAGYGKTTALRRYVCSSDSCVYILWMNYTKSQLFQRIAEELVGRSHQSYLKNLKLIMEVTRAYRKVIIIDEADRMPLTILEDLRTLNEEGLVPLLLVGEDSLTAKVKRADRIESRIRKPAVTFRPLDAIQLTAYYNMATGLVLDRDVAKRLVSDCHKDFRIAANDMQYIVAMMNANGQSELTMEVYDAIRRSK